ncbi:BA14K family protein [Aminobacter sp. Piv2-1]|uniref:BA14K family protein n=1 Tax=Aminobacter sp. Piv2-1 TaxID=3031122 RepID=UPI0030A0CD21
MNRIIKTIVLSAAVAATTLAALPAAQASDGWRHYKHRRDNTGAIVAAGALGLIAGAVIAGNANRSRPVYDDYYDYDYQPQPRRIYRQEYYRPAPQQRVIYSENYGRGYSSVEPWTPEWYEYCSDRYRSFKPRTGTFTGYDGQQHFCVAN